MKKKDTVKEDIEHWFGDRDKDNVINMLDCQPSNPHKHGLKQLPSYVRPETKEAYVQLKVGGYDVSVYASRFEKPTYVPYKPAPYRPAPYKPAPKPITEKKAPVAFKDILFEPTKIHLRAIGRAIRAVETGYQKHITAPISAAIGGEKVREAERERKALIQRGKEYDTAATRFGRKWASHTQDAGFVGSDPQYKKYQEDYGNLKAKFNKYEVAHAKYEGVGKPSPFRQFPRGGAEMLSMLPIFPLFATRLATGAIEDPFAVPVKTKKFGEEYYEFAKEEPFRAAGQIVAMAVGPKALRAVKGKVVEGVKFYGKAEIPVEQIVKPEVITGTTRFPVSKAAPRKLIKTFEHSEYTKLQSQQLARIATEEAAAVKVWHAAPKEFGKAGKVAIGESELPGLYVSPSLSPWFLRVTAKPKYKLLGLGLDKPVKPSAMLIETRGIERLPKGIRETGFKGAREFMFEEAGAGKAYITPKYERGWRVTPREEEAVIPPETPITRIEFTKFLKWEGKKVPIHEFAVEGLRGVTKDVKAFEKAGAVTRRYGKEYERYGVYREPIITPGGLSRLAFLSEVIEEDMRRIPKEERVFAPFEKKEERIPRPDRRRERRYIPREEERKILPPEERIPRPDRRRERRPVPPKEERWMPPAEDRILEPFEVDIKKYRFEEPPVITEEEWKPLPERPFREWPYKTIKIIPYEITPPALKKKKKTKKKWKTPEEELDEIFRHRKYGTLSPSEMLRM